MMRWVTARKQWSKWTEIAGGFCRTVRFGPAIISQIVDAGMFLTPMLHTRKASQLTTGCVGHQEYCRICPWLVAIDVKSEEI
jgi:hypothetical protein